MQDFILNSVENVVLVTLNNVPNTSDALAEIFEAIGEKQINIDMICQTAPYKYKINLSFTIDQNDLDKTWLVMKKLKQNISELVTEINAGNSKITIYSERLKTESGIAARLFHCFRQHDWQVKLITTSDVEISILVDDDQEEAILEKLKAEFEN
jgi:aspartokinase